jgi:hypothetical protein
MYTGSDASDIVRSETFWRDNKEEVIARNAVGFLVMEKHIFFAEVKLVSNNSH